MRVGGWFADFWNAAVFPKLRQRLPPVFFLRFAATQQVAGQSRREHDTHFAAENEKGGVAVIAFAHDQIAGFETHDAGVVAKNFAQRRLRGEFVCLNRGDLWTREQAIHDRVGHVRSERRIPTLWPGDGRDDFAGGH